VPLLLFRDKLRALRARDRLLCDYYDMGSSYGKPSPLVLQPLAEELAGRADLSVLWCVQIAAAAAAACLPGVPLQSVELEVQQWQMMKVLLVGSCIRLIVATACAGRHARCSNTH
jgi:hypothetical protein